MNFVNSLAVSLLLAVLILKFTFRNTKQLDNIFVRFAERISISKSPSKIVLLGSEQFHYENYFEWKEIRRNSLSFDI